ncbi:MAG: cell division protein ZipA [Porticoccaceae bacterium]|nr:cell division protein ZipA [Porticoccaceae bacterium]
MEFLAANKTLILVAGLVLVAIVLDGMRRAKRYRYENLQMSTHLDKVEKRGAKVENVENLFSADSSLNKSDRYGMTVKGGIEDVLLSSKDIVCRYSRTTDLKQTNIDFEGSKLVSQPSEESDSSTGRVSESHSSGTEFDIIIVHLMANRGEFLSGSNLLETLLQAGLRYGAMGIFHRHAHEEGEGPVLFSLANLVKPGTFDLQTISAIETPGVTLFLNLNDVEDACVGFESMITTAHSVAQSLKLNVLDESRSSITPQTIDHYRQRARDVAGRQALG